MLWYNYSLNEKMGVFNKTPIFFISYNIYLVDVVPLTLGLVIPEGIEEFDGCIMVPS